MDAGDEPVPRRAAVFRLVLVAGLLAVYPLGLMVLRSMPHAQPSPGASVVVDVAPSWNDGRLEARVELQNDTALPLRVDQVVISTFLADRPATTMIEAAPALEARLGTVREAAPHARLALGPFVTALPRPPAGSAVLVAVECWEKDARQKRTFTGQADILVPEGRVKAPQAP